MMQSHRKQTRRDIRQQERYLLTEVQRGRWTPQKYMHYRWMNDLIDLGLMEMRDEQFRITARGERALRTGKVDERRM